MKPRPYCITVLCALLISGCAGSRDYAKPPETSKRGQDGTQNPKTAPRVMPHSVFASSKPGPGWGWSGLEWVGLDEKGIAKLQCALDDDGRVRSRNAYGVGGLAGGVIAVVARAGGSTFFGRPSAPGGGHGHDGAQSIPIGTSVFSAIKDTGKAYGGSFLGGAAIVMGCQALLTSFPLDGLLGGDFMGLATALVAGGLSSRAVSPWVWRFFGEPPPPRAATPRTNAPSPGQLELDLGATGAAGAGVTRHFRDWSAGSSLLPGVWYRLKGNLTVLGVSSFVGLLVYHQLYDESVVNPEGVNPACLIPEPKVPPSAPDQVAGGRPDHSETQPQPDVTGP